MSLRYINIAYRVRVKEVAEYASAFPGVTVARDYLFMCSDPGQELIEAAREEGIEFVNLAAPGKVITENGRGIECVKNELGPPDVGRLNPINFSDRFPGLPQIQNTHLPG